MSRSDAERAFKHLFINEHNLSTGRSCFPADYYIATSVQRLVDTRSPLPQDLLLFKHEALESEYMRKGMSQQAAHKAANQKYNYEEALSAWIENGEGRA